MKAVKGMLLVLAALAAAVPAPSQDATKIKTTDFAWMTGRWIGHLGPKATAEQICSQPQSGEMLCLFRVFVQGQPAMYELYTLYDTPQGPQLRSLHFPTDLNQASPQKPLLMTLQKYTEKEVVFAGAPGTEVATSSLFRDGDTAMNGVIIFQDQKEPHIRVRWEKVAYDAKVDYTPPLTNQ